MAVLLICFTVIVIVFFVQWIFRDRSLHTFGQSLPGPKSLIILGNVRSFVFKNDNGKLDERFEQSPAISINLNYLKNHFKNEFSTKLTNRYIIQTIIDSIPYKTKID